MFGYTQEEMTGRRAVEVFPSPEMYVAFGNEAGPLLGKGLPFEAPEVQFRRRDGSAVLVPRARQGGRHRRAAKRARSGSSKTSPKRARRMIEVQAIMTNASFTILFTKNRVITRYNRGFAEMFGYDGDEALGLPGRALYPSDEVYDAASAAAPARCCRPASRSRPKSRWCARTAPRCGCR